MQTAEGSPLQKEGHVLIRCYDGAASDPARCRVASVFCADDLAASTRAIDDDGTAPVPEATVRVLFELDQLNSDFGDWAS